MTMEVTGCCIAGMRYLPKVVDTYMVDIHSNYEMLAMSCISLFVEPSPSSDLHADYFVCNLPCKK
jgi:hypothetical protein